MVDKEASTLPAEAKTGALELIESLQEVSTELVGKIATKQALLSELSGAKFELEEFAGEMFAALMQGYASGALTGREFVESYVHYKHFALSAVNDRAVELDFKALETFDALQPGALVFIEDGNRIFGGSISDVEVEQLRPGREIGLLSFAITLEPGDDEQAPNRIERVDPDRIILNGDKMRRSLERLVQISSHRSPHNDRTLVEKMRFAKSVADACVNLGYQDLAADIRSTQDLAAQQILIIRTEQGIKSKDVYMAIDTLAEYRPDFFIIHADRAAQDLLGYKDQRVSELSYAAYIGIKLMQLDGITPSQQKPELELKNNKPLMFEGLAYIAQYGEKRAAEKKAAEEEAARLSNTEEMVNEALTASEI